MDSASPSQNLDPTKNLIYKLQRNLNLALFNYIQLGAHKPSGYARTIKILIMLGADLHYRNSRTGITALMMAAYFGNEVAVDLLLAQGVDVAIKNNTGGTALMSAAYCGHTEIVKKLLRTDSSCIDEVDTYGATALLHATSQKHFHTVEALLSFSPNVDIVANNGYTPLRIMAKYESALAFVLFKKLALLSSAVDPKVLFDVVEFNSEEKLSYLLDQKLVDVNAVNERGMTPLMIAASNNQCAMLEILFRQQTLRINQTLQNGMTALMFAVYQGHADAVRVLVNTTSYPTFFSPGIDLNAAMRDGTTALMIAAMQNNCTLAEILCVRLTNKNAKNGEGWTALMLAANMRHYDMVQYLLSIGAKENIRTTEGYSAYSLSLNFPEINQLFICHKERYVDYMPWRNINKYLPEKRKPVTTIAEVDELMTKVHLKAT